MEFLIALLCVSQVLQGAALVAVFWQLREHDRVIVGLPELLRQRDQAMCDDFKRGMFEAISEVMQDRAEKKGLADLEATTEYLGVRTRRRTVVEEEKS
jgi:hypothetical protein